jgi:hypothetical protein
MRCIWTGTTDTIERRAPPKHVAHTSVLVPVTAPGLPLLATKKVDQGDPQGDSKWGSCT